MGQRSKENYSFLATFEPAFKALTEKLQPMVNGVFEG
jgi:hypothetical protein